MPMGDGVSLFEPRGHRLRLIEFYGKEIDRIRRLPCGALFAASLSSRFARRSLMCCSGRGSMADTDEIKYLTAEPGHDALVYLPDSKTFEAHPIVAWAILLADDNCICAQPITVLAWNINDDRAVRGPSGEVVCNDRFWPTAEMWFAEMKANDGVPLKSEDIEIVHDMPTDNTVLALDSFRAKLRGQ